MRLNPNKKEKLKKALIFIPVILAVLIVGNMVRTKKEPARRTDTEKAKAVRALTLKKTSVVPRAIGYGYVKPAQVWQIVPEVSGKIIGVSDAFKKGNFAHKGDVIIRMDPAEYRLAVAQMEAGIENIKAQLLELNQQEQNFKSSLKIEEEALVLKKKNVDRNRKAMRLNTVYAAQYEQIVLEYQNQLARTQDIRNSLQLIPASRKALNATLALNSAQLEEAKLNLEKTEILIPFDCRITSVGAEIGQFVQKGQTIGEADGIESAEIAAQIPMHRMRILMREAAKNPEAFVPPSIEKMDMDQFREKFGLTICIRLQTGDFQVTWEGRFSRADATIDAKTGTLGVIVIVDKPYQKVIIGHRPPLVRDMFCEVEVSGKPVTDALVIPRSAIHDGFVYVADASDRLQRKKAVTDFSQTNFCVIREGLAEGDRVIVSDLIPAIEGMRVAPVEDKELAETLLAEASGRDAVK